MCWQVRLSPIVYRADRCERAAPVRSQRIRTIPAPSDEEPPRLARLECPPPVRAAKPSQRTSGRCSPPGRDGPLPLPRQSRRSPQRGGFAGGGEVSLGGKGGGCRALPPNISSPLSA